MNFVMLFVCTLVLFLAISALYPEKAEAAELESIYVRVRISPEGYKKWLASPMKHMQDFDDWNEMTDEWTEDWVEDYYQWEFRTMGDLVKTIEAEAASDEESDWNSKPYIEYDEKEGVFTFAQLFYDENFINFMLDLSAYRTFADFKDTDGPDFAVIYPFFWDPGYTVIMEIGRGYAKFHTEETAPEAFGAFIERAGAHFDAESSAGGD